MGAFKFVSFAAYRCHILSVEGAGETLQEEVGFTGFLRGWLVRLREAFFLHRFCPEWFLQCQLPVRSQLVKQASCLLQHLFPHPLFQLLIWFVVAQPEASTGLCPSLSHYSPYLLNLVLAAPAASSPSGMAAVPLTPSVWLLFSLSLPVPPDFVSCRPLDRDIMRCGLMPAEKPQAPLQTCHLLHTPGGCSCLPYDCGPLVSWEPRGHVLHQKGCKHTFSSEF